MTRKRMYDDWQEHYHMAEVLLDRSNEVDMHDGHAQLLATQALAHATLATIKRRDKETDPEFIDNPDDEDWLGEPWMPTLEPDGGDS